MVRYYGNMVDDGGGFDPTPAPAPTPTVTDTSTTDSRVALSKLISGQTLTDEDKKILNLPVSTPAAATTNTSAATSPAPVTVSPTAVTAATSNATVTTAEYEKGSNVYDGKTYRTAAGAYVAAVKAAKAAGPPYPAPANTHWTLIGTEWKLYKDLTASTFLSPSGSNFDSGNNNGSYSGDTGGNNGGGTSGAGSSGGTGNAQTNESYITVSPTPLTPSTVTPVVTTPVVIPVKTAPLDTVLIKEDTLPIELMTDLIFENIGGQELINIARTDTVNGQRVVYQPIKNLTQIQQAYNPNNIVALQSTSDKYFQNFAIKLESKVPTEGTGPGGKYVYIDVATGSLIVEVVNIQSDEQVEVEITTGGTIYEAVL